MKSSLCSMRMGRAMPYDVAILLSCSRVQARDMCGEENIWFLDWLCVSFLLLSFIAIWYVIVILGNWFILFHNFLIIMFDQRRVVVVVMNLFHVYILHWYIWLLGLFSLQFTSQVVKPLHYLMTCFYYLWQNCLFWRSKYGNRGIIIHNTYILPFFISMALQFKSLMLSLNFCCIKK